MLVLEFEAFLAEITYSDEVAALSSTSFTFTPWMRYFSRYSLSVMSKPIVPTNL